MVWRGTDPYNMNDLIADGAILTNTQALNPRFIEAEQKLKKVQNYLGKEEKLILTGHSLGAGVTNYLARKTNGIEAVYAYAPGSNPWYDLKDTLNNNESKTPIYNFTTFEDPISIGSAFTRKNENTYYVPRKKGMDVHTIDNYIEKDIAIPSESQRDFLTIKPPSGFEYRYE